MGRIRVAIGGDREVRSDIQLMIQDVEVLPKRSLVFLPILLSIGLRKELEYLK